MFYSEVVFTRFLFRQRLLCALYLGKDEKEREDSLKCYDDLGFRTYTRIISGY